MAAISQSRIVLTFLLLGVFYATGDYCNSQSLDCRTNVFQGRSVVAAIDIGTAYSRWAYAPVRGCEKVATLNQWERALRVSVQDPTYILIEADGDSFGLVAYGIKAETKYMQLDTEEQNKFHYLTQFKGQIHDKERFTTETTVLDVNGRAVPALTVFALSIQFQKEDVLNALHSSDLKTDDTEILWVVTAWNDSDIVKQFMRAAAIQAGIDNKNLLIEVEADAASVYGRLLLKDAVIHEQDDGSAKLKPGTKYIVLDAGAGTVYVIANQVRDDENLKQLAKANCHYCGGTSVDESFYGMLETLVGKDVLEKFQSVCKYDHLHMLRQFEIEKRPVSHDKDIVIKIKISRCFQNLIKELTGRSIADKIAQSELKDRIWFTEDILSIGADLMKDIFLDVVNRITDSVRNVLDETNGSGAGTTLVPVGGFSNSPILQHNIQSMFSEITRTVKVNNPHLVVVKGTVILGSNPSVITERLSVYTYGFATVSPFVEGVHDQSKKIFVDGRPYCKNIFLKFLEKGQSFKIGEPLFSEVYDPSLEPVEGHLALTISSKEGHQTFTVPQIYTCIHRSPMYVTDDGCVQITNYKNIGRNGEWQDLLHRKILIEISFTGADLSLKMTQIHTESTFFMSIDELHFV